MSLMQLDTVYETYAQRQQNLGVVAEPGSIEFGPDSVEIYWAATDAKPADETEMVRDPNGPFTGGVYTINQASLWILVQAVTGTPLVREFRVAVVTP